MSLSPQQERERSLIKRLKYELSLVLKTHMHVAKRSHDSAICAICDEDLGWWCDESPDNTCHYFTEVDPIDDQPTAIVKLLNNSDHVLTDAFNLKNLNFQTMDRCLFCGEPEERK